MVYFSFLFFFSSGSGETQSKRPTAGLIGDRISGWKKRIPRRCGGPPVGG